MFYPERVDAPLKLKQDKRIAWNQPAKIFCGSVTDMFGEWVPGDWLTQIFDIMGAAYWHDFFILTKNPRGIRKLYEEETSWYLGGGDFLPNVYLGVSVPTWTDDWRIKELKRQWCGPKFVSFEPLLHWDIHEPDLSGINWAIIGAQTQPAKYPDPHWVANIIHAADNCGVPVFMKDNLGERVFKYCEKRTEPPKQDSYIGEYREMRETGDNARPCGCL
jgi:protein gp37